MASCHFWCDVRSDLPGNPLPHTLQTNGASPETGRKNLKKKWRHFLKTFLSDTMWITGHVTWWPLLGVLSWALFQYKDCLSLHGDSHVKGNGNLRSKVTANVLENLSIISEYFSLWSESITTHKSALLSWNVWLAHCSMGATITSASWDAYDVKWSYLHAAHSMET